MSTMSRFLNRHVSTTQDEPSRPDQIEIEMTDASRLDKNKVAEWANDYVDSSFFSKMTFYWATRLVRVAFSREIDGWELWNLPEKFTTKVLRDRLSAAWEAELQRKGREKAKMWRAAWDVLDIEYTKAFLFMMGWLVAVLTTNTVLIVELLNLLDQFQNGNAKTTTLGSLEIPYWGFMYVSLFFVGELFRSLFVNQHWARACIVGINLRGAALGMLFRKAIRLRRSTDAMGRLLNIIANDVERLRDGCTYGLFIIVTPITLVAIIGVGVWVLGPAILLGFAVLLLSVPMQTKFAQLSSKLRREAIIITDERVTLMNEILKAAQLVKLYAWEDSFVDKIAEVRAREMCKIRRTAYVKAANTAYTQILPIITSLVSFIFHTLVFGNELTAAQAFATLAIFNVSRFPLSVFPLGVRFGTEMFVSFRRLEEFWDLEEIQSETSTTRLNDNDPKEIRVVQFTDATFTWGGTEPKVAAGKQTDGHVQDKSHSLCSLEENPAAEDSRSLYIERFSAIRGTLTAVVGSVGSGKSSFLAGACLGDMRRVEGESCIRGQVAYVSQSPWIFNGTVRENILLGADYDERRFQKTIKVCALLADLDALPNADMTELGERGINVSGGQKARISLARAVYQDADVYLFDDVLNAVDAHVSAYLWKHCIRGVLKNKTVILATHALQYLPSADSIVVFENMKLVAQGTFNELCKSSWSSTVLSMLINDTNTEKDEDEYYNEEERAGYDDESSQAKCRESSSFSCVTDEEGADDSLSSPTEKGKLIKREERKSGAVSSKTVKIFAARAGGYWVVSFCFFLFWVSEGGKFGSDAWLSVWAQDSFNETILFYCLIYGGLAVVVALLTVWRGVMFAKMALRASQGLHDSAFSAVMTARMEFFQTTPLGRILARFSADMDKVDVLLVDIAEVCITLLVRCFFCILVIAIILPAFLIFVVPIGFIYVRLLNYFRRVVRQMKRIDNISRSPLISQAQSISQGLTSVRAYELTKSAIDKNLFLVEETSRAYLGFYLSNRWVAIRLDFITTTIVTLTALLIVLFASKISPGFAGLALASALQTAGVFQFATRQAAELEAQFTCVERLRHFIENTPTESVTVTQPTERLDKSWPERGDVEFDQYSVRYREGLPLVLNNVSFSIRGGQKVALVGRTGSGKSTSLLALFRILEAAHGRILIDGVAIASVPLEILRSRALSVVPQDPTLFAGTIRYNLDPFNKHDDVKIWECLESVQLAGYVRSLKKKTASNREMATLNAPGSFLMENEPTSPLDFQIEEAGSNLSVGQKQMLCCARALLRDTRIICIDEGTSSVDEKSDAHIQQTLRDCTKDKTMFVIAHRLNTIRNFDQVCVFDEGRLVEMGHPDELVLQPSGIFASMWAKSLQAAQKKS